MYCFPVLCIFRLHSSAVGLLSSLKRANLIQGFMLSRSFPLSCMSGTLHGYLKFLSGPSVIQALLATCFIVKPAVACLVTFNDLYKSSSFNQHVHEWGKNSMCIVDFGLYEMGGWFLVPLNGSFLLIEETSRK